MGSVIVVCGGHQFLLAASSCIKAAQHHEKAVPILALLRTRIKRMTSKVPTSVSITVSFCLNYCVALHQRGGRFSTRMDTTDADGPARPGTTAHYPGAQLLRWSRCSRRVLQRTARGSSPRRHRKPRPRGCGAGIGSGAAGQNKADYSASPIFARRLARLCAVMRVLGWSGPRAAVRMRRASS